MSEQYQSGQRTFRLGRSNSVIRIARKWRATKPQPLHQLVRTAPEWGCVLTHLSSAWARTRSCHAPWSSSTFCAWTATGTLRCLPSHLSRRHSCGPGRAGITSSGLETVRWSACTKVRLQWGTEAAAASPSRNSADSRSWNANTALCQVRIIEKILTSSMDQPFCALSMYRTHGMYRNTYFSLPNSLI